MSVRDPQTGQFVSAEEAGFDDWELQSFRGAVGIEAANLTGGTGFAGGDNNAFEGLPLVDFDNVLDRDEIAHLVRAVHRVVVYINSTETADGTFATAVEVSSSPSQSQAATLGTESADSIGNDDFVGIDALRGSDSMDIIGPVLQAVATAPFSDGATGVGGGGAAGDATVVLEGFPDVVGQFHPRDELFFNGGSTAWNIDDAAVHIQINGQHLYGITER